VLGLDGIKGGSGGKEQKDRSCRWTRQWRVIRSASPHELLLKTRAMILVLFRQFTFSTTSTVSANIMQPV
jgi:hypothetical protein